MDLSSHRSTTRVLFVTPECAPLTKTGGLGDVSAALPAALNAEGLDVRVLMPGYPEVLAGAPGAKEAAKLSVLGVEARLMESRLPGGVPLYILDCPSLYERSGGPYQAPGGAEWADNGLRFGLLSRVAALLGGQSTPVDWRPEIVHCNDWPTGLAPAYLRYEPQPRAAAVMTVHNLAFQGNFPPELLNRLALSWDTYSIEGLEFYGAMSFLKAGLMYADALTTVSPTYAREIQTEAYGCGLQGVLQKRRDVLHGILNGIDTAIWDPAQDSRIAQRYDDGRKLKLKAANKAALQRRMNLAVDPDVPLIGMVGRFTHQKGIDLVAQAADEIVELPAQLAVLGTGDPEYENALVACAVRHPGRLGVVTQFSEALAHGIEAGADLFLMPSRFEPCGLNQMYSQRYGTPPVARATGGLADTITDGETGFLFAEADSRHLLEALRRAIAAYGNARRWRKIQRQAMACDFSWGTAARQYADLYLRLASLARA